MALKRITKHPILEIPEKKEVTFTWNKKKLIGYEGEMISSALFANGIHIFGHHPKDNSPQGIFCANGQCSQCLVMVDGLPVKSCMTPLAAGMAVESVEGLLDADPELTGLVLIIGGEGFYHCFMRSQNRAADCPRCGRRSGSEVVAELAGMLSGEGPLRVAAPPPAARPAAPPRRSGGSRSPGLCRRAQRRAVPCRFSPERCWSPLSP